MAASDLDSSQEVAAASVALVPVGSSCRKGGKAAKQQQRKPVQQQEQEQCEGSCPCWLCEQDIEADQRAVNWSNDKIVHEDCASALRCHQKLLRKSSQSAKTADAARYGQNLSAWKGNVLILLPPSSGNRDSKVLGNYSIQLEPFSEDAMVGQVQKVP